MALDAGRVLKFNVEGPKNNVRITVSAEDEEGLADVETLTFRAHFLSLKGLEGDAGKIDFSREGRGGVAFRELILQGEDRDNDNWTLEVANRTELAEDGYRVEEVVPVPGIRTSHIITKTVSTLADGSETTTYSIATQTVSILDGVAKAAAASDPVSFDEAAARLMYEGSEEFAGFADDGGRTAITILVEETEQGHAPFEGALDAESRTLRVTRLEAGAENSRIVLRFRYLPTDEEAGGVFIRAIELNNGVPPRLRVEVTPTVLVVARGGSGEARLVISNLALDEDPTVAGSIRITAAADAADVTAELQGSGTIDRINRRFEQRLKVRAAADADQDEYTLRVEVRLSRAPAVRTNFTVKINKAPRYEGKKKLTVYESGNDGLMTFSLSVVDPDGGSRRLNPADLRLEVVGFGADASELGVDDLDYANDYFALKASEIKRERLAGNGNSLALTLTLSGRQATPFESVVELRLFGVTDGFDGFEQRLTVGVKNRPPVFKLAQTQGVKVFLEQQEPATLELLEELESGARVLVLEAPADLVVKFDPAENGEEGNGKVTLRRLDTDSDDLSKEVKLAALDAAGGLTEVRIQVERPPRLPRIVPPHPLLIAEGQSGTRTLQLAADTGLNVTWTIAVVDDDSHPIELAEGEDYELTKVAGGHARLSLTLVDSVAAGDEFDLLVTAFVGEEAGGYRRTAILPVVVAAAAPKPRLKLSATIADPEGPTGAVIVVSSFALGELLSIAAVLEGQLPSSEELGDGPSFQISILKLNADGEPDLAAGSITLTAASAVVGDELDISPEPVNKEQIAELDLEVGDAVQVSIGHLLAASNEVTDSIIVGDGLVLRVSDSAGMKDEDNDGLVDDGESEPDVLGPITAAVAEVTAGGVSSRGDGVKVSLSLGDRARFLGLGECGEVSLTLTLTDDGDGAAAPTLSGCGDDIIAPSLVLAPETLEELPLAEDEEYRLFDLSATFNSDEAGLDEPLVINLPVDRQQPHIVYRFDGDGNDGNGRLGAGLGCRPARPAGPGWTWRGRARGARRFRERLRQLLLCLRLGPRWLGAVAAAVGAHGSGTGLRLCLVSGACRPRGAPA